MNEIRLNDKEKNQVIVIEIDKQGKEEKEDLYITVTKILKWSLRHGTVNIRYRDIASILYYAMKGLRCDGDHLDISQRLSLYEHLKDTDVDCPYIKQFLKDTKERYNA